MSPVVGTRATRATAKTSSVPSLHLPDADRSEAVAAAGSDRWRVSSRCGRVAGFVSSGNSSVSIILSPAVRIGDHRTPQVIIDRVFMNAECGMRNQFNSYSFRIPNSEFRIPKRLAFLHQCVDWELRAFATWEVYGLQSWDGLFTLPYGHTRDLPLMIVGE